MDGFKAMLDACALEKRGQRRVENDFERVVFVRGFAGFTFRGLSRELRVPSHPASRIRSCAKADRVQRHEEARRARRLRESEQMLSDLPLEEYIHCLGGRRHGSKAMNVPVMRRARKRVLGKPQLLDLSKPLK